MSSRLSKHLPIFFVISTILVLSSFVYICFRAFSIYLYKHSHYPPNLPDLMAILSFLPSIIAIAGLLLKRKWSYFLTTIMLFYFGTFFICYIFMKNWVEYAPRVSYFLAGISYTLAIIFLCSKQIKRFFKLKSFRDISVSRFLIISIAILLIAEIFITKRYFYYQQVIFPPPVEQNSPQHKHWPFLVDENIVNEDIEKILLLLKHEKEKRHKIYKFSYIQDDTISVNVGELRGPLNADGFKYIFKKTKGEWKLVEKSWWIS